MSDLYQSGGGQTNSYNGKLDFEQSNNRILGRDENFLPRLLISAQNNQFRMRISKDGANVLTATDLDLIFNSDNNLFKIIDSDEIELTMSQINNGNSGSTSETIPVPDGVVGLPTVIAFVTFPSVQAVDSAYVRFFGGSVVQAGSVSSSDISIIFISEEEISATNEDITFSWKVSNATGFTQPEVTVNIKYFILTETAPPAPS